MENEKKNDGIYLGNLYPSKDGKFLIGTLGVGGTLLVAPNQDKDGKKSFRMVLLPKQEKPAEKPTPTGTFG